MGRQEALFLTTLLWVAAAAAEDKVEFKGSTSYELPKPNRNIEPTRTYKGGAEKGDSDLGGGFISPPPAAGSPVITKKYKEMMDKKQNWIFVNPYKDPYDSKTTEFMKGEKGTGLYNQKWMKDKDDKSQVEKFLAEKEGRHDDTVRKDNSDRDDKADSESKKDSSNPRNLTVPGENSGRENSNEDVIRFGVKDVNDVKSGGGGLNLRADEKRFMERLDHTPRLLGDQRLQMSADDKEKFKRDQQAHDDEFGKFLQSMSPRTSGLSIPGSADSLTPSLNLGAPEAGVAAINRPGQSISFGRGDTPGFALGGNPLSANLPGANRSFAEDLAPKASRPSGFAAAPGSLPSAQAPSFTPSPFQLTFPQRKF